MVKAGFSASPWVTRIGKDFKDHQVQPHSAGKLGLLLWGDLQPCDGSGQAQGQVTLSHTSVRPKEISLQLIPQGCVVGLCQQH